MVTGGFKFDESWLWSQPYPDGDYRTHTVPVKKYEPRMFMGKKVPNIATHYVWHFGGDIGFITYSWDNKPNVLVDTSSDNVLTWLQIENTKFTNCRIEKLPSTKQTQQENIMKKEFSKGDLKSGMKVILRNGQSRTVFKDTLDEGTVIVANNGNWSKLEEYDENFCFEDRGYSELDIDIVYTVYEYEMLYNTSIEDAKEILWKREEKTQEQLAYEALQAQIAEEEARHADSMKALREKAEKLKPKIGE